uniref:YhcG N-terminal domain-containing protein n=1 Tax=Candidatus Kentrum sp. DK TaxID=2126562 RepID=A0A450TM78_9GAMM|nr:MAG: Protein of unknown function (DUF1016) [Candidatus Kentron sp. DK]
MKSKEKTELPFDYAGFLLAVKERVRAAQYEAIRVVNTELVGLYWDIGRMIVERQETEGWGKTVVERLSSDLRQFPGVGGFSDSNLWRMKGFYEAYSGIEKLAPLVEQNAPAGQKSRPGERRSQRWPFRMHHCEIRKLCFSDT